jgi:hypothetical protein
MRCTAFRVPLHDVSLRPTLSRRVVTVLPGFRVRESPLLMTYLYEQLDPERFQHFCQALIAKEYPGTQCFPVGQRDGGLDAIQVLVGKDKEKRIFQIKFVREPQNSKDDRKWLLKTMNKELPKLRELISTHGKITEYILVTNVPGTAFPKHGSIDTLNELLEATLDVPIRAWWRDDLDRRCDTAADVKWSYPELLRGSDVLQALATSLGHDLTIPRIEALKAFAVDQYEIDSEVRFKQVELSNKLLNLFVDVPAIVPVQKLENRRKEENRALEVRAALRRIQSKGGLSEPVSSSADPWDTDSNDAPIGAATLLLDDELAKLVDLVILEGGPGQGKSTVAQYICQVHRMRVLGKSVLSEIPDYHRPRAVRFPIKIDLREYATWLAGKNPFVIDKDESRPSNASKALESFIAALVAEKSGGRTFTVDDFAAVARSSAMLVVLDGLDEVAEVSLRNEVVREISAAARRLKETAASLQILITTRPSALSEVSDFPASLFAKWSLAQLTRSLIDEYASRWIRTRNLTTKEASDIRRTLSEKLDQSHMRELARNPMQLTILLSVIHTRGGSLPDKRTALYDIYVELFLARESEKSDIVKKRQDLLIDVHRYLAWVLHSEAETGRTLGEIETNRLHEVLREYLTSEGRDPSLSDELFTGLAQRVVFLVGAVEGIFEFEVQPLREYFAGRFLYETAPYSPVGNPRSGTKDERFDAVARNMYWQNVTRFYAGCFSKGELPALVDRLEVLCTDSNLGLTSYPRSVAATLVADWVFSQNPRSLNKMIKIILAEDGYRSLLGDGVGSAYGGEPLSLPEGCGREELTDRCIEVLKHIQHDDVQEGLARLAQSNSSVQELKGRWITGFSGLRTLKERARWIKSGYLLGILSTCSLLELSQLFEANGIDPLNDEILNWMVAGGRTDYYEEEPLLSGILTKMWDGRLKTISRKLKNDLDFATLALHPIYHGSRMAYDERVTVRENLTRMLGTRIDDPRLGDSRSPISALINQLRDSLDSPVRVWIQDPEHFTRFMDAVSSVNQDGWETFELSFLHAKLMKREKTSVSRSELFDSSVSTFERARFARTQAGSANWWVQQLVHADTDHKRQIWALAAFMFSGPVTFSKLIVEIDGIVNFLKPNDAERFFFSLEKSNFALNAQVRRTFEISAIPSTLGPRTMALLGRYSDTPIRRQIVESYMSQYQGDDPLVLEFLVAEFMHELASGDVEWERSLDVLKRAYRVGVSPSFFYFSRSGAEQIPNQLAREIASSPSVYPRVIVRLAEAQLTREFARNSVPLVHVAEQQKWFSH